MKTYLVTGAAGFIGFHVAASLLRRGDKVAGLDNLNAYYDPALKEARLAILSGMAGFRFHRADIADDGAVKKIFEDGNIDKVCHLAAQAGVRYSLENPGAYIRSNEVGFFNVIENAKAFKAENFVYASSSSVYGGNTKTPFSENDKVDSPVSLYAATKKSNELVAHAYSHLFGLKSTGLRFFTVYGPYGRPDMALFKFTDAILGDRPIDVYNRGKMKRDFTYIDDIVSGVLSALDRDYPCGIFNLGNNRSVNLLDFIGCIEKNLGKKAKRNLLPMQPGDVPATCADIRRAKKMLGYNPRTPVEEGIGKFVEWYRSYYKV